MSRVAVGRLVALGGPMHARLIDDVGDEVTVKGTVYRKHYEHRVDHGAVWVWEGLEPEDRDLLLSEWTR